MTRWARAGNTQKHCKQPEDPTPWEDFAEQICSKKNQNEKFKSGKVKKHTNISKRSINNPKFLRLQAKNAEMGETTYSKSTKVYVDLKKQIESQLVKDNIAPNSVSIKRNTQQVEDYGNASQAHVNNVEEGIPVMPSVSEENVSIDMLSQIDKKYSSKPQQKWKNNKPLTLEKNDLKLMIHNESPHGNSKTANNSTRKFQVCSPQQKEQSMLCEDTVQEPLNDMSMSENTKMKKKKVNRKNPDCVSHQTGKRNKPKAKLKNNETIVSKKAQVKCNEDSNNIEYKNNDILKLHEDLNISLCEEGNFPSPKPEKKLNAISKKKKKKVALGIEGRKKRRIDPCSISGSSAEIIEPADSNQNDSHCNDLNKVVNNFDESEIKVDRLVQELLNDVGKNKNTKIKRKKGNKKNKNNPDCVSHETIREDKPQTKFKNNETIVSKKTQVKCNEDSSNIENKSHDILKLHKDLNISLCEQENLTSPKPKKKLNAISKKKKEKVTLGIKGRKKMRVDPCSISGSSAEIIEHVDSNQNDSHCNDLSKVANNFDESEIKVDKLVQELLNDVGKTKNTKIKRKKGNKKNKNNPDCVSHETIREDKPQTEFKNNETTVSKKAQVKCNEDSSNIENKSHDILKLHKNLNISLCEQENLTSPKPKKKLNAISKKKKEKVALGIEGRKKRRVDPCSISGSSAEIIEHADSNQNDPYCNDLSEVVNNFDESEIKDDKLLTNDVSDKKNSKEIKRNIFLQKRQQKRAQNGITLLPPKIENKLLRIKNAMRKKGLSGERIKEVIRYERRKEELKLKKIKKMCFNCREFGHKVADCPKTATDNEQGTGICFKCGSTEHTSHKCSIKNSDFPFAKCFVCQKMGHLSRHCAENKHGIYPKGGKCNLCGDINHLKKDCPKLFKVKEQMEVTADTMNVVTSVDAEIEEAKPVIKRGKTVKIVKFRH